MLAFHSWQPRILLYSSMVLNYSKLLQLMKYISLWKEHKLLLSVFHSQVKQTGFILALAFI
jgi:hypothetical protein